MDMPLLLTRKTVCVSESKRNQHKRFTWVDKYKIQKEDHAGEYDWWHWMKIKNEPSVHKVKWSSKEGTGYVSTQDVLSIKSQNESSRK